MTDEERDALIEAAFWDFLARYKGEGKWAGIPQSRRDAYKCSVLRLLNRLKEQGA